MEELQYTEENVAFVRNYFEMDETKIKQYIEILKKWIEQQKHLPKNQDDGFLERLLLRNKFRIEQTKKKLEAYYTIRGIQRKYYQENNENIIPSRHVVIWVPLSRLTPKCERVILVRTENFDPEIYDLVEIIKLMMLMIEIMTRNDYSIGDRILIDLVGISFAHFKKISVADVSHFLTLYTSGYSGRPRSFDFINCPSFMHLFMNLFKIVFPEKLFSKIKLHENLETIFETYPRECLPSDYGGKLESVKEIKEKWDVVFEKNQKLFNACYHDVSQEHLRVGELPKTDYFGVDGTFRKLTLD